MPEWLTFISILSIAIAVLCMLVIFIDIIRGNYQHMPVMNIVWPITALYSGPICLFAYFKVGRLSTRQAMQEANDQGKEPPTGTRPFWQSSALAATHCGSGCTLGDILAEGVVLSLVPLVLFGHRIFAAWAVDYIFAFLLGMAFQYFTITPMKHLSPIQGMKSSLKADTLSLTAWQIGMYGWMGITTFLIFGHEIEKSSPVFWFMMQIAMITGFLTSYPVNWWLIKAGIKEKM